MCPMEGPELGNVPFIFFFFSVRWESLVIEEDSPLLTSHTGPHHPHDLFLGVMAASKASTTHTLSLFSGRKRLWLCVLRSAPPSEGGWSLGMVLLGFFWMGHLLSSSSLTDIAYHYLIGMDSPWGWGGATVQVWRCCQGTTYRSTFLLLCGTQN